LNKIDPDAGPPVIPLTDPDANEINENDTSTIYR